MENRQVRERPLLLLILELQMYHLVLMLVVVEGNKYAEVAAMLDVPLGTVMSRLSRSRKMLSEHMRLNNVIPLRSRQ